MKHQKWEYAVKDITSGSCNCYGECGHVQQHIKDRLNALGQDGWELIDTTDKKNAIFKRPIEETITPTASPKTELPNCTCAVGLWSGKHLSECSFFPKIGDTYSSWDDNF